MLAILKAINATFYTSEKYYYGRRVKLSEFTTCIVLLRSTELSSISVVKLYNTFSHEIYWSVNLSPVHKSWSGPYQ